MTIFSVLKQEHRNINKIFSELEEPRDDSEKTREEWFRLLRQELLSHAEAEHTSLYDRLLAEPATENVVKRSENEHDRVKGLLDDLEATDMLDAAWGRKLASLRHQVENHVREEEQIIFPRAKAILEKTEQQEIAEDFRDRKFYLLENFA
jgi:hemerythrin superfamily protein